ncbi:MAG: hypothetical protein KatS3mg118_3748 [Paracoccaceae bacterium]|nr:MAG: glycosyltransferase family 2 protein [Alphaproteobacteria bacterium]GIX15789.1 MAG: hypothetical protein KatS3mg118_3748 [Paracoccaceae bacterium]
MRPLRAYRLRLERKARRWRAHAKSFQLAPLAQRTGRIRPGDILLFATIRNEAVRLPFFLDYYRRLGVGHFLFVDNDSTDGGAGFLADQADCSVWVTGAGYRQARYGMDWMNHLLGRYGSGHWTLTVDADEFLVYPHMDSRPLAALCDWLDAAGLKAYGALLIDLYPRGPLSGAVLGPRVDPVTVAPYFDAASYQLRRDARHGNLWIQGGPRQRVHFADRPELAPALNKIPLVRWRSHYAYVSSTHALLPRGLNRVYEEWGGEKPCGALLHAKFVHLLGEKAAEELRRRQHYAGAREYAAYARQMDRPLWTPRSTRYEGWRQLHGLGLISAGGWL